MEELLSYRLSDLLLFSEQTFYRQFALYREWLGPFQYLAYLYGGLFLFAWPGRRVQLMRGLALVTAIFWLICIYGFLHQFYAQINWMVSYLIPVIGLQPVLLVWTGIRSSSSARTYVTPTLWVAGLMHPVLELAGGRSVEALSAYALTPDSLAICSLALMFTLRQSFGIFVPALLWLLFSALTYYAMGDPMFWYLFFVLLTIATAMFTDRYRGTDTAR